MNEVRPPASVGYKPLEACVEMVACLNAAELLATIPEKVTRVLCLPICVVLLKEGEFLVPRAFKGIGEYLGPLNIHRGPWEGAVSEGKPASFEGAKMPPDWAGELRERRAEHVVVVPFSGRAGVVGAVIVARADPFGREELEILHNLCRVAGVAFDNARLYEDQIRRNLELQALAAVGRTLTATLEVDEILSRILAVAVDLIGAEAGYLLTLTEKGHLSLKASKGLSPRVVKEASHLLGGGIPKWAATYGRSALVTDVKSDPRHVPVPGREVQTMLCAPLRVKDRAIGVVCLENKIGGGPFTQNDLNLMIALSGQASLALENADLWRRLNQKEEEDRRDRQGAHHDQPGVGREEWPSGGHP